MATATQLSPLRSNLQALGWKRQGIRWGTGWSGLLITVLVVLAIFFVLDYWLKLTLLQRVVAWGLALLAVAWGARKYLLPFLGQSESVQELALFVEKQQQIDTDLIAALQFDEQQSSAWGSTHLQAAVVDYVADYSKGLDVFAGLNRTALSRRLMWAIALLVAAIALGLAFPDYAKAFIKRLALGNAHYPTATKIETLFINGREVDLIGLENKQFRFPYGQAVKFELTYAGEVPQSGKIELTGSNGARRILDLQVTNANKQQFSVELPQLFDDLSFQGFLGDAQTDTAKIQVIQLPVIDLQLSVKSPDYVLAGSPEPPIDAGTRQIAVIEGSAVAVKLNSNKQLKSATLKFAGKEAKDPKTELPLVSNEKLNWTYSPTGEQPLASITDGAKFELQVVDQDDLTLPTPIECLVRVKPDRVPTASLALNSTQYLATATPQLDLRVTDDYGLRELKLRVEVIKGSNENLAEGTTPVEGDPVVSPMAKPIDPLTLYRFEPPLRGEKSLPFAGMHTLKLEQFQLKKGDQVKLVLEAIDDRGTRPGKSALSDPVFIQIGDESSILAISSEQDEKAARMIENLLKVQTGGNP
jgi:hypothetical protein